MKITLSKSQWNFIGKKTGWMKTAAPLSENTVPVSEILGTSTRGTESQIDDDMHSKGYFLFREHYPWGKTLSYQNKQGDKIYLDRNEAGQMVWMTWDQLKEVLRRDWRPPDRAGQDWFVANIGNHPEVNGPTSQGLWGANPFSSGAKLSPTKTNKVN